MVTDMFYYNNQQLWQELLLVKATHKFYIPGWTLGVEAVLSLLLPLFIIAAQKNIRFVFIALITSLLIGPAYISMFTMHFCLGILLAYYLPTIQAYDFKRSAFYPYRWILAFIPFVLFSVRHVERIKPLGGKLKQFMGFWSIDLFHITGVASCIILLYVLNNSKAQQFLNKSIFMFLGKISYSLYLMHWLVVIIIMDKWEKYMYLIPNTKIYFFGMFGIYISITFILAMLLYKYVEKPMIEYAKRF
jgi:peptidoglycan/LPS O-acetylase OafA/YrhL